MWYGIVIFCVVFDLAFMGLLPFFIKTVVTASTVSDTAINTTSELISTGTSPMTFLGGLSAPEVAGASAVIGAVFLIINILLAICLVKLIRGS